MPDRYLSSTYIRAHLGTGYESAVTSITGVSQTTLIESATSLVQAAMRNSGYATPTSTDGSDQEEAVRFATLAVYRELLSQVPEGSIPLPENWRDTHAGRVAEGILEGTIQLAATPTNISAVGGWQASENDEAVSVANGSRPQRASRENLSGY